MRFENSAYKRINILGLRFESQSPTLSRKDTDTKCTKVQPWEWIQANNRNYKLLISTKIDFFLKCQRPRKLNRVFCVEEEEGRFNKMFKLVNCLVLSSFTTILSTHFSRYRYSLNLMIVGTVLVA